MLMTTTMTMVTKMMMMMMMIMGVTMMMMMTTIMGVRLLPQKCLHWHYAAASLLDAHWVNRTCTLSTHRSHRTFLNCPHIADIAHCTMHIVHTLHILDIAHTAHCTKYHNENFTEISAHCNFYVNKMQHTVVDTYSIGWCWVEWSKALQVVLHTSRFGQIRYAASSHSQTQNSNQTESQAFFQPNPDARPVTAIVDALQCSKKSKPTELRGF